MQLDPETLRRLAKMTLETRPDGLSCEEWIHLVAEYIEATRRGTPLDERLRRVEEHTAGCPSCAEELDVVRRLLDDEPRDA